MFGCKRFLKLHLSILVDTWLSILVDTLLCQFYLTDRTTCRTLHVSEFRQVNLLKESRASKCCDIKGAKGFGT